MSKFGSKKPKAKGTIVAPQDQAKKVSAKSIKRGGRTLRLSPESDMGILITLGPVDRGSMYDRDQQIRLSLESLMTFRKNIDDLLLEMAEAKATDPIWMVESKSHVDITSFGPFSTKEKAEEFSKGPFGGQVYNARVEIR